MRKMKDSGIEWIGEIPEDWNLLTIKRCISTRDSGAWGKEPNNSKNDIICIRVADFDYSHLSIKRKSHLTIRNLDTKTIEKLSLETGNILIEKSGGGEKTPVGRAVIFEEPYHAIFSNFIERLKINTNLSEKFFLYLWTVIYLTNYTNIYIRQTTGIQNLDITALLSNTQFPLPDLTNQVRIANFLDEKCAVIDRLVERHQEVIEKLKAYRQSVISETVTRGLDPDAPMKDSGIPWIGKIPEDWEIIRLKFLASHNDDVLSENTPDDLEFDYIDISSVQYGSGIINKQHITFGNAPSRARRIVRNNDVIISTVRTYLKAVAIIPAVSELTVASTGFACLRTNKKISPKFLYYSVLSDAFVSTVEAYSVGISYPAINASQLVCLKLLLPSIEKQNQIADYLDEKCAKIDRVIHDKEQIIAKLAEYKKSIIYEYVTGKKEVPAS